MSRSVSIVIPEKKDALSRIKKFMSAEESGVVLTAKEEIILARLIYAHGLLKENKFRRDQVAEKIKEKFSCSIHTARADIDNTYSLFIKITEDYKRYTLYHHIEFIDQMISQWKDDKSLAGMLPKLLAEKTKAIAALPVDQVAPDAPVPIILIDTGGRHQVPTIDPSTAREEIDQIIELEEKENYIDYEDMQNKDE